MSFKNAVQTGWKVLWDSVQTGHVREDNSGRSLQKQFG